jgi:hypothetical protein
MAAKKKAAKKSPAKKKSAKHGDPLERVREICLAFPESTEVEAWGEPTFRVKGKIFAMHASANTHHGAGRQAIWIMSDSTTQDLLMRARPTQYFKPPYVGPNGWVGAWLDGKPIWSEINELLRDAFRKRAPKKVAAMLLD